MKNLTPYQQFIMDKIRRWGYVPVWLADAEDWQALNEHVQQVTVIHISDNPAIGRYGFQAMVSRGLVNAR